MNPETGDVVTAGRNHHYFFDDNGERVQVAHPANDNPLRNPQDATAHHLQDIRLQVTHFTSLWMISYKLM